MKSLKSRVGRLAVFALSALSLWGVQAHAAWPDRPITLVVPFVPGGGTDSIARELGHSLGERLKQTVIIENRGGGGGAIGANHVAKASADGYTLLFVTSTFVTHAAWEPDSAYDPVKDFAPVALIGRGPLLVVASPSLGVDNIGQLLKAARSRPQGIDYCSAGPGSINHLAGELFHQKTGAPMTHVPYKGSGPATLDLLAGRVQLFFATVPTILPSVQSGRVKLLAVTSGERSTLFPKVPTLAEAGVKDMDVSTWWGVEAPAGTPPEVIAALNQAVNAAAAGNVIAQRLKSEGATAHRGPPEDLGRTVSSELAVWKGVSQSVQSGTAAKESAK